MVAGGRAGWRRCRAGRAAVTNVPEPRRPASQPSASSWSYAAAVTVRLTPSRAASARVELNRFADPQRPAAGRRPQRVGHLHRQWLVAPAVQHDGQVVDRTTAPLSPAVPRQVATRQVDCLNLTGMALSRCHLLGS